MAGIRKSFWQGTRVAVVWARALAFQPSTLTKFPTQKWPASSSYIGFPMQVQTQKSWLKLPWNRRGKGKLVEPRGVRTASAKSCWKLWWVQKRQDKMPLPVWLIPRSKPTVVAVYSRGNDKTRRCCGAKENTVGFLLCARHKAKLRLSCRLSGTDGCFTGGLGLQGAWSCLTSKSAQVEAGCSQHWPRVLGRADCSARAWLPSKPRATFQISLLLPSEQLNRRCWAVESSNIFQWPWGQCFLASPAFQVSRSFVLNDSSVTLCGLGTVTCLCIQHKLNLLFLCHSWSTPQYPSVFLQWVPGQCSLLCTCAAPEKPAAWRSAKSCTS